MNTANAPSGAADDLPLKGLRVLELGQFIAAPAAGQALVDLGADVIKLEPPGGDAARQSGWSKDAFGPMFSAYNRDKRSVVFNLRSDAGRAQAQRLALSCDVVLANARPGAMEKQGLGAAQLMAQAPRLIYGRVSAFGQTGPSSTRAGLDIAAQAESGIMSMNGFADREPVRVGYTVVDVLAASALTSGVLAALLRRGTTGRGGLVELSLIDVAVASMAYPWAEYRLLGQMPLRRGNGQATVAPAAEVIATRNGMIVLSAYTEEHFPRLCAAIERPELVGDPRFATNAARVQNRPALLEVLHDALSHFETDALVEMLNNGGIVAGAVRTMAQVQPGKFGVAADLFVDALGGEREPTSVPGQPMQLDGVPRRAGRLPAVGEHTQQVLDELGA
ncbi:MAG: CoA transferase [Proteobacteria bacterium]|nr:CoA transferase [Pseudomonadota bacterium]